MWSFDNFWYPSASGGLKRVLCQAEWCQFAGAGAGVGWVCKWGQWLLNWGFGILKETVLATDSRHWNPWTLVFIFTAPAGAQLGAGLGSLFGTRGHPKLRRRHLMPWFSKKPSWKVGGPVLDPWEDPKSRCPNSGFQDSYGVDYRTLRGIYFLDPPRGLGYSGV